MPAETSPAFQFYTADFLSHHAVAQMTNEQIGAYVLLLCHAWNIPDGLPTNLSALARLARATPSRFESTIWPVIQERFCLNSAGRFYNNRLEEERTKQREYREQQSRAGKISAQRKADRKSTPLQHRSNDVPTEGVTERQPDPQRKSSLRLQSSSSDVQQQHLHAREQPLHGRRNPDLMTYGPIPLWASQFRDVILPLVATHYAGSRDEADASARAWVRELDTANQATPPLTADVQEPVRWWSERALTRWGVIAHGLVVLTDAQIAERDAQVAAERAAKEAKWREDDAERRRQEAETVAHLKAVAPQRIAELRARLGKAVKSV